MGRFVTVTVQCDWSICEATAEEGDDTIVEKTLSIDGKQAKAFLLCKNHLDDFERIVLPLMAAGIKVDTVGKKSLKQTAAAAASAVGSPAAVSSSVDSATIDCRIPNCDRRMKNRAGLAQHVIKAHGFEDLAAYEAAYPDSTID